MEIDKRIIALIEILGLTPGEFADKINVQRSGISHITSGRNKPSLDFLERTLTVFPEINSEWLVLGKGKPLKSQIDNNKEEIQSAMKNVKSPLLFPMDDDIEKELVEYNTPLLSTSTPLNTSTENKDNFVGNIDTTTKKEVKKIIVLYNDNSFEVYENHILF